MKFKDLLKNKNISGYALAKNAGIPYTTINDLINGKTFVENISLKHAIAIADCLKIDVYELVQLDRINFVQFRYFRNNLLHDLKRQSPQDFISKIIKGREIDYYYKNKGFEYAYYLLALIDHLSKENNISNWSENI